MTQAEDLRKRTKLFAITILDLGRFLPRSEEGRVVRHQIIRSATSVAANYRSACRARTHAEFIAKIGLVVEETDETVFWLELIVEAGILTEHQVSSPLNEAKELLAIFAASQITAKRNRRDRNGKL